ncbi:dephospho-CoA kinase [Streptococcus varani]|uniref:Dephospho-CoA kinase n=1 Tax=Streptococcus varani TaxID=1608583 RepID=A0A0E4CTH3_9STRE|nr:dephospho-CoA kinase [Streptococcus varani]CQR25715.1 dephospho-CoA kinase [Streptococcus varani]
MTKIIGITGGIASGKSTVVEEIRRSGYKVIDADAVVHDLQAKGGKLYQALVGWFGQDILMADGQLDRIKLSQEIFSSSENLAKSADLQNQIIRQELAEQRDCLAETEEVFFMDIPLLIELDYQAWFDQIWLVYVDEDTQIKRLMERNGYNLDQAHARIATQMPFPEKKKYASLVLDNNGSLEDLKKQVHTALQKV